MIVAGAVLVPALSLPDALVAILVGCVIGNLMLAAAGMIGADARVPGMAHLVGIRRRRPRRALGRRRRGRAVGLAGCRRRRRDHGFLGAVRRRPAGGHYTPDDVFESPAWRAGLIAAWLAGFALYQWLYPTGPAWWVDLLADLNPPDWGIGATVPSFLVSFALALAVALVTRRNAPA